MTKKPLPAPKESNKQIQSYTDAVKKGLKAQHIVSKGGHWAVKRVGATGASKTFDTQSEAVSHARKAAKSDKSDVFIHGRDGRIRERASYSR